MESPTLNYEHFQIETDITGAPVELDSNGQGVTYRAYDTRLRKTVALKIVRRELLQDDNNRKRFLNEARAAAALDHPNIARVIHLCPADADEFYYAMEIVDGEPLTQYIEREGPMPLDQALRTLQPIAEALIALGNQRFVHRDIQPGNIMLTTGAQGTPTVKLIDFGLAKSIGTQAGLLEVVNTAELRASSVYNLSPEQIHGNIAIDSRADFYALGITLWTLLTGHPPFVGSPFEVNEGHLHRELPWAELPNLPPPARGLLESILAKSASDRPADAHALCKMWEAAIASAGTGVMPMPRSAGRKKEASKEPAEETESATAVGNLRPLHEAPEGCSEPSPAGVLAEKERGGALFVVRTIPEQLSESVRDELLQATKASLDHPHPALLNAREIRGAQIVSDWRKGITAAKLIAIRRADIPHEVIRGWLPAVAQAVDWARENGVQRATYLPTNWLVEFLDAEVEETPLDRALREPGVWGRTAVRVDPLAGFDSLLLVAESDPNQTLLPGGGDPLTFPSAYISAFARGVREALGGHYRQEEAPLATISEAANALLLGAIKGRSGYETAEAWAAAFLASDESNVPVAPVPAAAITPGIHVAVRGLEGAMRRAPAAAKSGAAVGGFAQFWRSMPVAARWAAIVVALFLVGGLAWGFLASRARAQRDAVTVAPVVPPASPARQDLERAEGAFANGNRELAKGLLQDVRSNMQGNDAQDLEPRIAQLEQRMEATAPKPPRVTSMAERIEAATKDESFENALAMKFVPVPITGGETDGSRVLFASTETTVGVFEKFANKELWKRQPGQQENDPAVYLVPTDAEAFCRWMNKKYKLPGKWEYRLPTDHEWSCAAGIGDKEDAALPAKQQQPERKEYAWGAWPPKPASGNFADESFRSLPGVDPTASVVSGYNDGFAGTSPVGTFAVNRFGLFDLAGNAAEWCYDSTGYVLRGGSYYSSKKAELDLAARRIGETDSRQPMNGFRVVISDRIPPRPVGGTAAGATTGTAPSSRANQAISGSFPGSTYSGSVQTPQIVRPQPATNPGTVTTITPLPQAPLPSNIGR